MLYTITLQDIELRAYHGCYDLEQKVGNRFLVDLNITTELGCVADEDAVEKAVNYLTVYEIVREVMRKTCRTIEAVQRSCWTASFLSTLYNFSFLFLSSSKILSYKALSCSLLAMMPRRVCNCTSLSEPSIQRRR